MAFNLKNRSFLKEIDFTPQELRFLLQLSGTLKSAKYAGTETHHLAGKNIALIFEKTSTRTRSAFEVGAYDQGAHVTYLDPSGSQLGHKESIADTASVLGRMYDAIEYRGNAALLAKSGNPAVKFMHCLPAFHDTNTVVRREIMEHTGMTGGLEVTDEVFRSGASIVFDQGENRLHTIKAILVATLGR